ncbi:DUF1214 domain-containing protein [Algoriphagus marinus]|uniref:DUF1214 domain-containing protein n=1 Tax=Algoriphagus marinus TaxID=1925762 RepID=UPI00094BBCB9|nr:DUF1214 domain-containing protein [Algoriphagus marinus]
MSKSIFILILWAIVITSCTEIKNSNIESEGSATPLVDARLSGDETIDSYYGTLELEHNFLTDESAEKLFDALDFQRASQAYIWSTPIVSFYTWIEEQNKNYDTGELGEFAVFQTLKEKRGIVTANLTTPYIIQFCNLANGGIEIDYPAGQTASAFLDLWQRPIGSMGLNGPDQGKGGTYIIIGPNEELSKYEKKGVQVYQSATNSIFIGMRLIDSSPEVVEKFKSALKMGRVGEAKVLTVFKENIDKEWSATAPRDMNYWRMLHQIINEEPVREQDKVWMAMLEPLGIMKGKDFNPSERQTKILLEGLKMGELMLRNLQTNPRFAETYWEGKNWYKSFDFTVPQITDYKVELDERSVWFYEAVTSTESMVNPTAGKGQVYMTVKRDSKGELFRADKTYKLTVPKDVPVLQFWALTLYSENTRRPYDNGGTEVPSTSLDSKMKQLQYNEDGSIDLYIGNKAPKGLESNFMKTVGKDGWFVYFRLYAPTEPFFNKSFQLNDFEVVEEQ